MGLAVRPDSVVLQALAQLVESSSDSIALLDEHLRVIHIDPAGCEIVSCRALDRSSIQFPVSNGTMCTGHSRECP